MNLETIPTFGSSAIDHVLGARERAELAAFEALLSKCIADAHGVDVLTWLTRDKSTDE